MRARVAFSPREPSTSPSVPRVGPVEVLCVALALVMHVGLIWLFRAPAVLTGNDQAWYILLARSLRDFSYENAQFAVVTPHTKFPPGYPTLLSLVGVTSLDRIGIAIAVNACLSATTLALTYAMLRRLARGAALLVVATAAVNPSLVLVAGSVNSEPLFMALSALALFLLARQELSRRSAMLAAGALVAAALTRTIGVAYVLALGLLWIIQRQWRRAFMLGATSLVTVGAWMAWSAMHDETRLAGQSYLADAVYSGSAVRSGDTRAHAAADSDAVVHRIPGAPGNAETPASVNVHRPRGPVSGALVLDPHPFDTIATTVRSGVRVPALVAVDENHDAAAEDTLTAATLTPAPATLWGVLTRRAWVNSRAITARKIPWTLALPLPSASRGVVMIWVVAAGILTLAALPVLVRHFPAFVITTSVYTGVLVVWPFVLERYLVPIVPAVLAALIVGALVIGERAQLRAGWRYLFPGLMAGTLVAFALSEHVATWRAVSACDRSRAAESPACFADFQREYFAAAAAVRALPDDGGNFLVSQEPAFHLLTGRHAAREAEAVQRRDPEQLLAYLHTQGVSYVLLSRTNLNQWSLARPLLGLCSRLRVMQTFGPHAALLRLDGDGMPGEDACAQVRSWAAPPWPHGPPPRW